MARKLRPASTKRWKLPTGGKPMPDLSIDFCGVRSPNPFWLASGPPSNTAYQVMRAFDAGWGGAVWKTIGEPIINTASRYGSIDLKNERMIGLNNIELISDRSVEVNLREIAEVKKHFPKHTVIASLMVESKQATWHDIVRRTEDSGADLLELNFGCPMSCQVACLDSTDPKSTRLNSSHQI